MDASSVKATTAEQQYDIPLLTSVFVYRWNNLHFTNNSNKSSIVKGLIIEDEGYYNI